MENDQWIRRFKMDLLRKVPFYGDVVARLTIVPSMQYPIAATDGCVIYYNPQEFSRRPAQECRFILMHEVMHVILRHASRHQCENRDKTCWNVACDLIVNRMVGNLIPGFRGVGIEMNRPPDALFRNLSDSTTAEELYAVILADQKANEKGATAEKKGMGLFGKSRRQNQVFLRSQYVYEGAKITEELVNSSDDLRESELSVSQHEDNESYITGVLRTAAEGARGTHGSFAIPDEVYGLLENGRLHWKRVLRSFLTHEISDDSSYVTPERKYLHMDMILPGHSLQEESLESVWVFIDSSGSISHRKMEGFLTELYHLVRQFHCVIHLAYWDTAVTDVYKNIRSKNVLLECTPKHSGGTDINCVYRWIRENHVRPEVMIILTDGYYGTVSEEWFDKRLSRKTILILDSSIGIDDAMRRLGKVVRLDKEGHL